jgi:hypothetical protein
MSTIVWSTLLPASLSAIAALSSAATALIVARIQYQKNATDAFFKVMDRFESVELRKIRYTIYALDRDSYAAWTADEIDAVATWSAHIDLVASLIVGKQINGRQTFELYGDVLVRSIYILAPYCQNQLPLRGTQYLIALRKLSNRLPRLWKEVMIKDAYAGVILIPGNPQVKITPSLLRSDRSIVGIEWRRPGRFIF